MSNDQPIVDSPIALQTEVERRIIDRLVEAYRLKPSVVAEAIDTQIDRSGALLGWLREITETDLKGTDA